jgi:hypothetical protein
MTRFWIAFIANCHAEAFIHFSFFIFRHAMPAADQLGIRMHGITKIYGYLNTYPVYFEAILLRISVNPLHSPVSFHYLRYCM